MLLKNHIRQAHDFKLFTHCFGLIAINHTSSQHLIGMCNFPSISQDTSGGTIAQVGSQDLTVKGCGMSGVENYLLFPESK